MEGEDFNRIFQVFLEGGLSSLDFLARGRGVSCGRGVFEVY